MCGIVGFIGHSKQPTITFDLINSLLVVTEIRGDHATGFWCTAPKEDNRIVYHKEPIKAVDFVQKQIWKDVKKYNPDLLLGHCRYSSTGVGSEKINRNNHPHVATDGRVALVHNGRIIEYNYLKSHYKLSSDCDSEVLLRIFESGEEFYDQEDFLKKELPKASAECSAELLSRVWGLKEIFSKVNFGSMATAIGERRDNCERTLWLFRNTGRPLALIDLRPTLGQIFFCSVPEIFRAAVSRSQFAKEVVSQDQEVAELCSDSIFYFNLKKDGTISHDRWEVRKKRRFGFYEHVEDVKKGLADGSINKTQSPLVRSQMEIVTNLDGEDEVVAKSPLLTSKESVLERHTTNVANAAVDSMMRGVNNSKLTLPPNIGDDDDGNDDDTAMGPDFPPFGHTQLTTSLDDLPDQEEEEDTTEVDYTITPELLAQLDKHKDEAKDLIDRITTAAKELAKEGNIPLEEFQLLVEDVERFCIDLKATKMAYEL
jgi:hypothetical protein